MTQTTATWDDLLRYAGIFIKMKDGSVRSFMTQQSMAGKVPPNLTYNGSLVIIDEEWPPRHTAIAATDIAELVQQP